MKLLNTDIRERLFRNGRLRQQLELTGEAEPDFLPVVKLFTPDAGCTWLLTEIDPDDPDIAFGLCDLGMGYPELGSVSLSELAFVRGKLNLPVERDLHFTATKTLSAYADKARAHGAIKAGHVMTTNITEERRAVFEALHFGRFPQLRFVLLLRERRAGSGDRRRQ
jgi:hypothetical protein